MKIWYLTIGFFAASLLFFSCKSSSVETAPRVGQINDENRQISGGLAEEIRSLTESGYLSLMLQALELIRSRDLGGIDFGRVMNGINTILIKFIYPDSMARLPVVDIPQTLSYARIINEAEKNNYVYPLEDSTDFFEYILPFFAVNKETSPEILAVALKDLKKASELRPNSVIPPYFLGIIYEYTGNYNEAEVAFNKAYGISNECYPALAGAARMMRLSGKKTEAAAILSELVIRYPDSLSNKKQLAISYYENKEWSRAGTAVDEILQNDPRDGEFLLMKAHILIEQGNYSQSQAPLDTYASINPNNRFYLFFRARVQAEGNHNRDSALNYLRSIIRTNPDDDEVLIYAARLLMESPRPADQAEGREFLGRLRQISGSSIEVLSLGLRDAIHRESWKEAQEFLNRILAVRRTVQDIIDAYHIEQGLGNNSRALAFAKELYDKDNFNSEYIAVYISALIDNGRKDEASGMLESRLTASGSGTAKSRFYYLRSRLQTGEESALGDLRSSLFEDPRNLEALIAMFEIYHRRREERRAVYYLKQALAIAPDNPRIKRYEREYSSLLGKN